jgi:hypothetical protein
VVVETRNLKKNLNRYRKITPATYTKAAEMIEAAASKKEIELLLAQGYNACRPSR